ncbi:MAG: type II secretion system protein [Terracidiphilus sp.]
MEIGNERREGEEGYVLVAVIFLLFMFALMMAVAVPEIGKQIQLDREHETMERGKQYVRAIQLYYRKFHSYPPSIDALVKTNNIRFLRKKYIDPMTGKDDWRVIHFGQAKTQTLGFFGQPLASATGGSAGGTVMAGVGPSGNNQNLGGIFGDSGSQTGASGATGTSDATSGTSGASGSTGSTGSGTGTNSGLGSGQTFGGPGIIGVAPALDKQSIMIFKKKQKYSEWEFVYDPLTDVHVAPGSGLPGQSAGGTTTQGSGSPGFGGPNSPGFGGSGGPGFGGSSTGGTPPTSETPTPQPQQQ